MNEIHSKLAKLNEEANVLMDEIQKAWEELRWKSYGIRSIIIETDFTDRMSYNVFGQDDFEDVLDCFSREDVKSEPEVGFLKYGYR